jgi:hypothetical protein
MLDARTGAIPAAAPAHAWPPSAPVNRCCRMDGRGLALPEATLAPIAYSADAEQS